MNHSKNHKLLPKAKSLLTKIQLPTLISFTIGATIGLLLGGVAAVLAELTEGILSVALNTALAGGLIALPIGLLAGISLWLDTIRESAKQNRP